MKIFLCFFLLLCVGQLTASSFRQKHEIPAESFATDKVTMWNQLKDLIKNYEVESMDERDGRIQTRWIDDTRDQQFYEDNRMGVASRYSLLFVLTPLRKNVTKLTIFKKQEMLSRRTYSSKKPFFFPLRNKKMSMWK